MQTDWEAQYQKGETPWDKGAASPALVDYLAHTPMQGRVLVPGCGLGHDVRAIAGAGGDVLGIDIAPSAIAAARSFTTVGTERYELADLFALPAPLHGACDWVWEHTCFCAIDRSLRPAYVTAVATALRPGGRYLAVFYLDPGWDNPNEGPPFGTSLEELDQLFLPSQHNEGRAQGTGAAFTLEKEWSPARTYPGREGREWMRLFRRTEGKAS